MAEHCNGNSRLAYVYTSWHRAGSSRWTTRGSTRRFCASLICRRIRSRPTCERFKDPTNRAAKEEAAHKEAVAVYMQKKRECDEALYPAYEKAYQRAYAHSEQRKWQRQRNQQQQQQAEQSVQKSVRSKSDSSKCG